ncbi:hypothetical protein BD324DRAFT_608916 [Kockovaella imperatae]|uniref:Uncharacterized protein n=1 Tax=Kockovaella imperatae TaxID=4999 RepID=A0A1Y1UHE0_9TREE|nr:hypothetical protein BD324DRAFT_608916 [Kockovaella imperatae]ORX36947.1 hypothetical protein BD324DRAFT_608916 [Kockovaella imperatae]
MQSTKGLLFANNSSHFHDEDPQAEIEAVVETASEIVDKVEDTDSQGEADPGDSTLNTFSAPEGASELGKALTSNDAVESWAEGKVDIVKRRVAANTSTFEQASVPSGLEDQRRAYIARRAASSPVKTVVPTSETQSAGQDSLAEGTDFRSERPSSKCEEDDRGKGQRAGELTESSTESQKEGASGDTSPKRPELPTMTRMEIGLVKANMRTTKTKTRRMATAQMVIKMKEAKPIQR